MGRSHSTSLPLSERTWIVDDWSLVWLKIGKFNLLRQTEKTHFSTKTLTCMDSSVKWRRWRSLHQNLFNDEKLQNFRVKEMDGGAGFSVTLDNTSTVLYFPLVLYSRCHWPCTLHLGLPSMMITRTMTVNFYSNGSHWHWNVLCMNSCQKCIERRNDN